LRLIAAQYGCLHSLHGDASKFARIADSPALTSPAVELPVVRRSTLRTSDGVTLSFLSTESGGTKTAAPIVFVPGWGMPASIWSAHSPRSPLRAPASH